MTTLKQIGEKQDKIEKKVDKLQQVIGGMDEIEEDTGLFGLVVELKALVRRQNGRITKNTIYIFVLATSTGGGIFGLIRLFGGG